MDLYLLMRFDANTNERGASTIFNDSCFRYSSVAPIRQMKSIGHRRSSKHFANSGPGAWAPKVTRPMGLHGAYPAQLKAETSYTTLGDQRGSQGRNIGVHVLNYIIEPVTSRSLGGHHVHYATAT
ncbi:hypothetical protein DPMN_182877 [Dreissena polymorpha]|uniref:Uncharacterized protein n=1 Tax=Dreissena polymorpha TaxID=45954 RepID=A0A9D4DI05_DREPO|nr:hypothetical protein DPMN_182877 [Dreissena polymorpha]